MRVVLQRVSSATVSISGQTVSGINHGLLALLGIGVNDTDSDVEWLCKKILALRVFPDDAGKMNRDILQSSGEILVVSQFTLLASTKKGNRPSFIEAARPETALPLYEKFITLLNRELPQPCKTGVFGADMQIALVNDGPVTIVMDSRDKE